MIHGAAVIRAGNSRPTQHFALEIEFMTSDSVRIFGYASSPTAIIPASSTTFLSDLFVAVHESGFGTSRQFATTHQFGHNRRHSGHAGEPRARPFDANDPSRKLDCASQQSGNVDLCGKPPLSSIPFQVVWIDVSPTPPPPAIFSIVSNFEQSRL